MPQAHQLVALDIAVIKSAQSFGPRLSDTVSRQQWWGSSKVNSSLHPSYRRCALALKLSEKQRILPADGHLLYPPHACFFRLNRVESKIAFRLWAPKGKSKGQPIFSQRRANFNFKLSIFPRSAPNSNRGRRGKIIASIFKPRTRIWTGSLVTSKIQKNKKLKSNARAAMSVGGFAVSLWWRQSGLWTHSWPSYFALIPRSTPQFPDHLPFEVSFYVCTILWTVEVSEPKYYDCFDFAPIFLWHIYMKSYVPKLLHVEYRA